MIPYIMHASLLLGLTILFYWLLLRKETYYKLNRGILLASIALSLLLPLITVPAQYSIHEPEVNYIYSQAPAVTHVEKNISSVAITIEDASPTLEVLSTDAGLKADQLAKESMFSSLSISQLIWYAYLAGVLIFAMAFLVQLFILLFRIYTLPSINDGRFKIIELNDDQAPYSFLNCIFINPSKYNWDTYDQILKHEKIHIEQIHFFDKFVAEALLIAFWFNPFVWLYRTAITNNLEFLTDQSMLVKGTEKKSYQMSLLEVSVPQYPLHLTTSYNHSFLKNRIAMMNAKKSSASSSWKYLTILPLLLLTLTTINAVEKETVLETTEYNLQMDQVPFQKPQPEKPPVEANSQAEERSQAEEKPTASTKMATQTLMSNSRQAEPIHELYEESENNDHEEDGQIESSRSEGAFKVFKDMAEEGYIYPGEWKGKIKGDDLCFKINNSDEGHGWTSYVSTCIPTKDFTIDASKDDPDWILKRDAGTLTLEGKFKGKKGEGYYDFEPNQEFVSYLGSVGARITKEHDLIHLFIADMDKSYVEHIVNAGFKVTKKGLIALSVHDIDRDKMEAYMSVFSDLAENDYDLDDIVQYEIHDVSPEYVNEMRLLDVDLNADNIVQARIHDVDPEFIRELKQAGYTDLDMDDLTQFAIHDVDSEMIVALRSSGFDNMEAGELVQFAIHDIDADYIKELKALDIKNMDTDDIIQFAIHGVRSSEVALYHNEGFHDLSSDDIIQMSIHGVDGEYVKELRDLKIGDLDVHDIVQFSIHDVDPSDVKAFGESGYDLDPDAIIHLSIHDIDPEMAREFKNLGFDELDFSDLVQAGIHDVKMDFVKDVRDLGIEIDDFNDIIQARIHGVSSSFIKKAMKKGYKLKTLDEYTRISIHGLE